MSTQVKINEIQGITGDIKRYQAIIRKLRARKKELSKDVLQFLDHNHHDAVKYKNLIIRNVQKTTKKRKKKPEKVNDLTNVLKKYGINGNYTKIIDELNGARQGTPIVTHQLQIAPPKNDSRIRV